MSKRTSFNTESARKSVPQEIKIGEEPALDLSAYYNGPQDPRIEADLQKAAAMTAAFVAQYKGKIASLSAPELLTCIRESEAIGALSGLSGSYASILRAKNAELHGGFAEKIDEKLSDMSNQLVFMSLELAAIEPAQIKQKMQDHPPLAIYRTYLESATRSKPHQLSETEEKLSTVKNLSGRDAWVSLYDQLMPSLRFPLKGKSLSEGEILEVMYHDPDRKVRAAAYKSFTKGLKDNMVVLAHITNTLALDKAKDDEMRKFPTVVSARNLSNNIDDSIVEALNNAVVSAYPRTAHRFYEIKRKYLGLQNLKPYDRNVSLLDAPEDPIRWDQARRIVIDSYAEFSPELAQIADMFFEKNWIDGRVTPGKDSGAFSHPMVVDRHPVVFINWRGTRRDVAVLAHELGHAAHQWLAGQNLKSDILADTPLTLAETASIFGEKLVFERLLAAEKDPQQRIAMLAGKIDDGINSIIRQIAFFNFEKELHTKRRADGRLKPEEIGDIFMKTQTDALGPAFALDEDYKTMWSYIPHFIHTPFYVYAYAFGECMVNSLYEVYKAEPDKDAFVKKYTQLLKDGGSKDQTEAVKPFGLDLTDPAFWDKGMKSLEEMIDRLDAEIKLAKKPAAKPGPQIG